MAASYAGRRQRARAGERTSWTGAKYQLVNVPNARGQTMLHVAMSEAVNALERRYAPYKLNLEAASRPCIPSILAPIASSPRQSQRSCKAQLVTRSTFR